MHAAVNVVSGSTGREGEYFRSIDVNGNSISIPTLLPADTTVVSVYYSNMSELLPGNLPGKNDSILATGVISASLLCDTGTCDIPSESFIISLKLEVDQELELEVSQILFVRHEQ